MKKSQAAMEYLMTYGWAILIIVIVLAALYAMGIFNPPVSSTCIPVSPFTSCGVKIKEGSPNGDVTISAKWPSASASNVKAKQVALEFPAICNLDEGLTSGTQTRTIGCGGFTVAAGVKKGAKYTGSLVVEYKDISGLTQQVSLSIGGAVQ